MVNQGEMRIKCHVYNECMMWNIKKIYNICEKDDTSKIVRNCNKEEI